jgi:hypothetical protein
MKSIDLTGKRYGRLTVINREAETGDRFGHRKWVCRCDCGLIVALPRSDITTGHTRSCGCLRRELATRNATRHGLCETTEYTCWRNMHARCYNPKAKGFHNYGGRGIQVCIRWHGRNGLRNFIRDMGPKPYPQLTIERKNNERGYKPSNCKWATLSENLRNRRKHVSVS